MNTLRPISERRAAKVRKAGGRMKGTFHVKEITAEEYRKMIEKRGKEMRDAINGTTKLRKKSPRQIAKERALAQFSKFIRLRDSDAEGMIQCCTCPARKPIKEMQCGHYVTTKKEATKFDENNSHGQCPGCNRWQGGKPIEYEQFIDRKYGPGTALAIRTKAVIPCPRKIDDYRWIEARYREKYEALLAQRMMPNV